MYSLIHLPNGAKRGPDAAWLRREKWDALGGEEQEKLPVLCPDFVVELMSPSDRRPVRFKMLRAKMEEYQDEQIATRLVDRSVPEERLYLPAWRAYGMSPGLQYRFRRSDLAGVCFAAYRGFGSSTRRGDLQTVLLVVTEQPLDFRC